MKKIIVLIIFCAFLCGCAVPYRLQMSKPAPLTGKDEKNAVGMSQILGIKHENTLVLDSIALEFALQYPEYFADSVRMLGFKAVAVPFAASMDADIETARGREMFEFVMFLNMKSLKTFYLLREGDYINRRKGTEFVWGKGNPYRNTLLNLKNFWRELPDSAEMPTVIIALEMNHWNDSNVNRPAGLLFTWRKGKDKKGDSNDRMFCKSMRFFDESRQVLDLEQVILMLDEEVVCAGEKGALTDGTCTQLLKKADALAVNFSSAAIAEDVRQKLQFVRGISEKGCVFAVISPKMRSVDSFSKWLGVLRDWNSGAFKYEACAGIWVQDWMKLNKIWRLEK